jgi:hypothetical protein
MPSEQAETTVALIIEACQQSGMPQESFGKLLGLIAKDFKAGKVHQPERPN